MFQESDIRAATEIVRSMQGELLISLERVLGDVEERMEAISKGRRVSFYQNQLAAKKARQIQAEIQRLERVLTSRERILEFIRQSHIAGRNVFKARAMRRMAPGYEKYTDRAYRLAQKVGFEPFAFSEVPVALRPAAAYMSAMSQFVNVNLIGPKKGLFRVIPQNVMTRVQEEITTAILRGRTYNELQRKLSPIYRLARGSKASLFEIGDLGSDAKNAMRAATTEMNRASNITATSYMEAEKGVIGFVINASGACKQCIEAYAGPRGDFSWLFSENPPVVGSVHPNDDCFVDVPLYRDDPRFAPKPARKAA